MSRLLFVNRQRGRRIDVPLLQRVVRFLLEKQLKVGGFNLCFHLVGARTMARVNDEFLGHAGSTDVITFDYTERAGPLCGEVFICPAEAMIQARSFRTTCAEELVRYFVHATLHLLGEDDRETLARRRMKRREDRLVRELARRFPLSRLARRPRVRP
jgi:rRNA maturation RNase YbeY